MIAVTVSRCSSEKRAIESNQQSKYGPDLIFLSPVMFAMNLIFFRGHIARRAIELTTTT